MSLFGGFRDKSVEDEYLSQSLRDSTRLTGYMALLFGFIVGLFVVHSYLTEGSTPLFSQITPIRLVFILVSIQPRDFKTHNQAQASCSSNHPLSSPDDVTISSP